MQIGALSAYALHFVWIIVIAVREDYRHTALPQNVQCVRSAYAFRSKITSSDNHIGFGTCRDQSCRCVGFYTWHKEPLSRRALEDARQTGLMHQAWTDSGKVYGYCKLTDDLRDAREICSENRAARLASIAGIAAQIGYKRRPVRYGGKPAVVADNTLDRQFEVDAPNRVWVTDITYIRTHEGWSCLSVVIDLFSRRVVG